MLKRTGLSLLVLVLATGATLATFLHQQDGPFTGVYGNVCGPSYANVLCIRPVLQAGWPMPYAFDNPGIAVPDSLDFEDDFHPGFFAVDVWFFACIIVALRWFVTKQE